MLPGRHREGRTDAQVWRSPQPSTLTRAVRTEGGFWLVFFHDVDSFTTRPNPIPSSSPSPPYSSFPLTPKSIFLGLAPSPFSPPRVRLGSDSCSSSISSSNGGVEGSLGGRGGRAGGVDGWWCNRAGLEIMCSGMGMLVPRELDFLVV